MPRTFTSIDEIRAAIGEPIGPSKPLIIEQERIDAFADATGDHQWIHVDVERAASGRFGTTIAHGLLTLAVNPLFFSELVSVEVGTARINYGLNKVRFPSPVKVGDSIRATVTVNSVTDTPNGALVAYGWVMDGEGPKPVCIAETLSLIVS